MKRSTIPINSDKSTYVQKKNMSSCNHALKDLFVAQVGMKQKTKGRIFWETALLMGLALLREK